MTLFEQILKARGLDDPSVRAAFLNPDYAKSHDPFLLPDMDRAVERLILARHNQQNITIYGDYDIDGLTATSVLLDALASFGFENVDSFIPNRFVEGYGLTVEAVEKIAASGANLIITVDCGSLSEKEIIRANQLGVDVIVTDHHNVAPIQPPAVAVVNPKRLLQDYPDQYQGFTLKSPSTQLYPFLDLPGVGVAFKLVQALQTKLDGLEKGQEKWLLDLVALGTVCDVVRLEDENRIHVYWGLKVLAQTRRPGLKALMAVAGVEPSQVTARSLGFGLGPRMNATGRMDTAVTSLEMLCATDPFEALDKARQLDDMNARRRSQQDKILKQAIIQAELYKNDPVLVLSAPSWNHGIIGIVAAKLLEKYKKPTFVIEEMKLEAKGSARSYGDFSAADAIRASDDIITKGGGHKLAAGVSLPAKNIDAFRERVNQHFKSLNLPPQPPLLLAREDVVVADLAQVSEELVDQLASLEPFGSANPEPILRIDQALVIGLKRMGADQQHLKLAIQDINGKTLEMLAFNADSKWFAQPGDKIQLWFTPGLNEWRGRRSVEGRIVRLEIV